MILPTILFLFAYSACTTADQDVLIQQRKLADLEVIRKLNYSNAAISMGPDLVFIDRGETYINPSQATVLKPIQFNSLKRDRSEIRRISKIHETCCHNITLLYTPHQMNHTWSWKEKQLTNGNWLNSCAEILSNRCTLESNFTSSF